MVNEGWEADSIQTEWSNRYGTLVVAPVTEVQAVGGIRGADMRDELKFDLETAEKIALITDNRRCQISGDFKRGGRYYLLVHVSCSRVAVVRIVSLDFADGVSAREEIVRSVAPASL